MVIEVEQHQDAIRVLCRKHGVKQLVLFGSASRSDDFDPAESDIDMLVEFRDYDSPLIADQYLGLLEDLERIFGRHVDLGSYRLAAAKLPRFSDPRPVVLYAA